MTQERVKCPFCSELILRDAIKCRFCGEWFTKPDKDIVTGGPSNDPGIEYFGREHYPIVVKSNHSDFQSSQESQQSDDPPLSADDNNGKEQFETVNAVEESHPVRIAKEVIPVETTGFRSDGKCSRIPWIRAILLIFYLGIVAALVVAEFGARGILYQARAKEDAEDPNAAFSRYRAVQDIYPFTFASIEAQKHLRLINQSHGIELPEQAWLAACQDFLGVELEEQEVYLLPLAVWPISALMLLLVFLTRVRRVGVALIALFFMILAVSGSVAQLAWYSLIPLSSVAEAIGQLMQAPVTLYIASYVLLILTAFLTLTATVARINLHIAKMAQATAGKK